MTKPIKMLTIDDKSLTTDLDRSGYKKMGVAVSTAGTFDAASKILEKESIDVIVVNLDYEKADGIMIIKHLKSQEDTKAIPIVATSVQPTAKARSSAIDSGAELFVEQPLPRQYFIEKIKALLEQKTRTSQRIEVHGKATFTINGKKATVPICDLSPTGMLVAAADLIELNAVLEISMELSGIKKPLIITGETVRHIGAKEMNFDGQTGVGIRFVSFLGDSQVRIEKYIMKSSDVEAKLVYYL